MSTLPLPTTSKISYSVFYFGKYHQTAELVYMREVAQHGLHFAYQISLMNYCLPSGRTQTATNETDVPSKKKKQKTNKQTPDSSPMQEDEELAQTSNVGRWHPSSLIHYLAKKTAFTIKLIHKVITQKSFYDCLETTLLVSVCVRTVLFLS